MTTLPERQDELSQWRLSAGAATALMALVLTGCEPSTPAKPKDAPKPQASVQQEPASPAEAASTQPALNPGQYDVVLTIKTDDPQVKIASVSLDGRPLETEGLGSPTVRALLVADPEEGNGTPCTSEGFEIALSNAAIYRPIQNFCTTKYALTVPASKPASPNPMPFMPEEFAWTLSGDDAEKFLALGIPETDATVFVARCNKGATRMDIDFLEDAGPAPSVDILAPDRALRMDLNHEPSQSSESAASNKLNITVDDAFWKMLGSGARVTYRVGGADFRSFDGGARRENIAAFLAFCRG
jgi:hypothetical protein